MSGEGVFRVVGDGHYHLAFPNTGIEFTVDRLRRERYELWGELSVACGILGARAFDGVLSVGTFNLSNPSAARQRASLLAQRARATGIKWDELLEELRQRVLSAERTGEPSVALRDVPLVDESDDSFDVLGLVRPRNHSTVTFGDGGTCKSLLELHIASDLASRGERVAYCDWEMDAFTHRRRLQQINGAALPDVRYVRLDRPLIHEVDRLRRIIRQDRLTYLHLDSIGYGTHGAPESAEAAMDYCRAVRQLGVGTGQIAHITKGENGDQRPFGSVFWHNSARATWNLKSVSTSPDGRSIQLACFHRKANLGRLQSPVGIRVDFDGDRIYFTAVDAGTIDEIADKLPLWQRIRSVVASGPLTLAAIASELGHANLESLDRTVRRNRTMFTKVSGSDGVTRIALVERRAS